MQKKEIQKKKRIVGRRNGSGEKKTPSEENSSEILNNLWVLGIEQEQSYCTGPPGYIGWRIPGLLKSLKIRAQKSLMIQAKAFKGEERKTWEDTGIIGRKEKKEKEMLVEKENLWRRKEN